MILASLGVGLMTAYYFGVQPGIWAGAAALALCFAALIPGVGGYAYVALGVGVAAIAFVGPKHRRPRSASGLVDLGKRVAKRYGDSLFSNRKPRL